MSAAAAPLHAPPPRAVPALPDNIWDWAKPMAARQLAMLERLAEEGMRLAETISHKALDTDETPDLNEAATAFGRVARAVRLTILLQSRLAADVQALDRAKSYHAVFNRPTPAPRPVAQTPAASAEDVEHEACEGVEALAREAAERLDRDDIHREAFDEPIEVVAARICRDLGIGPDRIGLAEADAAPTTKAPGIDLDRAPSVPELRLRGSPSSSRPGRRRSG